MQIRKVIQRRIRHTSKGVDFAGDITAAISANVGERSSHSSVSAGENRRNEDEPRESERRSTS